MTDFKKFVSPVFSRTDIFCMEEKYMRLLFEIDTKDYNINGTITKRPSVRGIIIKNNQIAMIHSLTYDYYKFPGGGIEKNETHIDALIREVKEESGLKVIKNSISEYGYVHRIQKGDMEDVFIQENYYYLCDVENTVYKQSLDEYEYQEKFTLEWVSPETVLDTNRNHPHGEKQKHFQFEAMSERECGVIEILMKELKWR